jgi:hypothetical protein
VTRVVFSVDGLPQLTLTQAPYAYDWDASSYAPGPHQLTVQATGLAGDVTTQTLTVTVAAPTAQ